MKDNECTCKYAEETTADNRQGKDLHVGWQTEKLIVNPLCEERDRDGRDYT